ncbi:FIG00638667: hypothetical protein [hydrothermal vent metagenome]|uniref:Periplasmic protein YibQ, distant homology with nucleoside diphosphatase and polysaccharide deacetylase n=1 Tax=hydrothermal vent metagenome TaxID=652676 RepID=A0A1W1EFJ6_9ZZZZ
MSSTSKKKKPITTTVTIKKRASKKRKPRKKTKKKSNSKKTILTIVILLAMVLLVAFGYFLGQDEILKRDSKTQVQKEKIKTKPEKVQKIKKVKKENKVTQKEEIKPKSKTFVQTDNHHKFNSTSLHLKGKKPKLVIIIDDVHTKAQISAIKNLKMHLTPSIFPPYKNAPNSNLLAQGLKHYMIHLPMESSNKKFNAQYKTLKISFSNKKIENRVKELRLLFPNAKYVNNHTGSVFTSDYASMHYLYKLLKENGFVFIDSKTKNTTKGREIAYSFGDAYVSRDIFIDNQHSIPYIHNQLRKAVKIAKKRGYAIAIGHPHVTTLKALSTSSSILKDVELVYIDNIYK